MSAIQDLISEVEKYPFLWNLNDENYQNKIHRDLAWERICQILIENWDDLNPEEKKKLCEEKKKRWNNLRGGYRKYLNRIKNTPTRSGALPPKKYTYMDNLYFLTQVLDKSRPLEGSLPLSPQGDCENNEENTQQTQAEESVEEDEGERNRRRIIRRNESANSQPKMKKNKVDDIPQQILNIVQQKTNAEPNFHDEDSQFLLSFRNDLKSMSRSQKLKFKLGMIQLIQSITESRPSSLGNFPHSSPSQIVYTPTASPSPEPSEPSFSNNEIARQIILSSGTSSASSNYPNTFFSNNADNRPRSPVIYLPSPNPSPQFLQNSPVVNGLTMRRQSLSNSFTNATVSYDSNTSVERNPFSSNTAIESVPIFSQSDASLQPNSNQNLSDFFIITNEIINQ